MPDYTQTRSDYLKIMMGDRKNTAYRPEQMNDVGDTSFDVAALSDEDINSAIEQMAGTQYEKSDVFKSLQEEQTARSEKGKENKPWWQTAGDFLANIGSSVFEGILNVADDVFDFGVGLIGGIAGGWYGQKNDVTEWASNVMTDDRWIDYTVEAADKFKPGLQLFTNIGNKDYWDNYWTWDIDKINAKYERRYQDMDWLHKGGNFVGEMIPSIVLAGVTGGASLGIGAQAGIQAGFGFARGMGGAQSRALSQGASFQQATGYGFAEGGINAALSAISVKVGGSLTKAGGNGIVKTIGQNFGKVIGQKFTNGTVQVVADKAMQIGLRALGSAGTAAVRTAFEPALQMIYDDNAWYNAYGTEEKRQKYGSIIAKSALTAFAGSAIVNTGRELFGVIRAGGFEQYKENYFADLARSETMSKMTRSQRRDFVKSQREYLDHQRQIDEIQKQVNAMRDSGKTDAEIQSFVASKMQELAPKIEAWTEKYQDFYSKLSYQVGQGLTTAQKGMSQEQAYSSRNRGANRFAGMIRDLRTGDSLKASLIKLGVSISSRGGDFNFTSDDNGGGQAEVGTALISYRKDSDSVFYQSKQNLNLPAVEAKVVDGKAVLAPKTASELQTIASISQDPEASKSLPVFVSLPLKDGTSVQVSIEGLTGEQTARLFSLTEKDFNLGGQNNGLSIAQLGGDKAFVLSANRSNAAVVDANQITPKPTIDTLKPLSLKAEPSVVKMAAQSKEGKVYDLSSAKSMVNAIEDSVKGLLGQYNLGSETNLGLLKGATSKEVFDTLNLGSDEQKANLKEYLRTKLLDMNVSYNLTDSNGKTVDNFSGTWRDFLATMDKADMDKFDSDFNEFYDNLLATGRESDMSKAVSAKAAYADKLANVISAYADKLNSIVERYRDRVKTLIGERKEANAKAENTRLLSNQIHRLRNDYPLRDSSKETTPAATRGNARWAFVHHIHGKNGSYSLSDNFFKSIEDYASMVAKSDIKDSGYYLQEVQSAALLSRMASILSGVNEVGADGNVIHHALNSAQERLILDTINEIKKIVKVEKKLDVANKVNAHATRVGLNQVVDARGKVSATFFKGLSLYGANFLKPDTAFKLMFGASNAINDILGKELNDAFNKAMIEYEKNYNEILESKFKELKLGKDYFKGTLKFRGKDVPVETLMTIYAVSKSRDVVFDKDGNPSLEDGNNLVSLKQKGISYSHKHVKHDIYWDENLLSDVEKALPVNYKKMIDWAIEFGNTTSRKAYERMSLAKTGADTTNTIQGVYVPKKSDNGRSGFGAAVVSAVRDLHYTESRTGAVNELTSYDVASEYGKQYLNTLITEHIMPVVSKINGIFSAPIDEHGHTLLQIIERDPNLSSWISKAIDNKVKAVMGISDERFKDNIVLRMYNAVLKNVGVLSLALKPGPLLKQPVSDFAIPGFSNAEMIALQPLEVKILSDKAKMAAINKHNADTFYGARIRNKRNAYAAAMLNAEDGLNIVSNLLMKPFSWMDKGAMAFGNAYIAAHLQVARPELVFGSKEYWAASDELTANLYNYSVNHLAINMPIVMNSNNPIAKTVSIFQAPNMLMASGVADVIADVETYSKLPSLEELEETKNASAAVADKAKSEMDDAEKRLDAILKEDEGLDYSSMSKEEKAEQKKKIDDASEDYANKSNEYAKAKGKADQDKKNYDFKKKFKPAKSLAHAVSTIIMVSALMVALSELNKRMLGKKDWDDWDMAEIGKSFGWQSVSGYLPGINILVSSIVQGYDISASGFDVINDIKEDVQSVIKAWNSGKFDRTMIMPIVDIVSRAFGIPIKNAYDLIYGIIKTFDPATAIQMKDFFYGVSASSLSKVMKNYEKKGDFSTSSKLMQRYYLLYKTGEIDHETAVTLSKLEAEVEGFNPIARNIPEYVQNEEGEKVYLSEDQRTDFAEVYARANEQVSKLIKNVRYKNMDSATKAKSIKKVYDLYYETARYQSLGVDPDSRLGKLLAYAGDFDSDLLATLLLIQQNSELTDNRRFTKKEQALRLVNQQSMTKVQKLLTLYLMGYGVNSENRKSVQNYLVSIGFTKKQAEEFLPS